jgi:hypothetical protein
MRIDFEALELAVLSKKDKFLGFLNAEKADGL